MLTTVTTGVGLVGAGALAVPFVASMTPSARAKAAGAPVEVDISRLSEGQMLAVEWRGKPVWIIRRTPEMLEDLAQVEPENAAESEPAPAPEPEPDHEKLSDLVKPEPESTPDEEDANISQEERDKRNKQLERLLGDDDK